jgi:hypothetical protein
MNDLREVRRPVWIGKRSADLETTAQPAVQDVHIPVAVQQKMY